MAQPAAKGYRRKNYFIDKSFQSDFILRFCGIVAFGALLSILVLYFLASHSTTVGFVKARVTVMTTADFIFPLLVQTMMIVTVFVGLATIVVTLFVSHKIAGPLYRFKQTFQELAHGNFTDQVRLRKGDQLHEVAGDFNKMISVVRDKVKEIRALQKAAVTELDLVGEYNIDDAKRHHFLELRKKLQELERAMDFFRT